MLQAGIELFKECLPDLVGLATVIICNGDSVPCHSIVPVKENRLCRVFLLSSPQTAHQHKKLTAKVQPEEEEEKVEIKVVSHSQ